MVAKALLSSCKSVFRKEGFIEFCSVVAGVVLVVSEMFAMLYWLVSKVLLCSYLGVLIGC